jgi:hypothetical protein
MDEGRNCCPSCMEASESGHVPPPRNPLEIGMATVGWVLVVLAALLCVTLTRWGLEFAHQETCGPNPPWGGEPGQLAPEVAGDEWRTSVTSTATGVTAIFELVPRHGESTGCAVEVLVTIVLLLRGRIVGLLVAFVCVLVALVAPVFATLLTLFSSAMC